MVELWLDGSHVEISNSSLSCGLINNSGVYHSGWWMPNIDLTIVHAKSSIFGSLGSYYRSFKGLSVNPNYSGKFAEYWDKEPTKLHTLIMDSDSSIPTLRTRSFRLILTY